MTSWLKVFNKTESKTTEVLLYGSIGEDFWDEKAKSFAAFKKEWDAIPSDHAISIRVNSPGGSVWDGLPIHNLVAQRRDRVTAYVEGVAASIASVIPMAAGRVVMPRQAEVFIHEPWAGASGDAAVMENMADRLNFLGDQIADIYAKKCGKSREEMRGLMKANGVGTSFLGQAAKDFGLVDEITDAEPMKNEFDLSRFRSATAPTGGVEPPPTETQTKQKETTMDSPTTIKPTAEAAPTTSATPPSNVVDVAEFNRMKEQLAEEKRRRVRNELNILASERDFEPADWENDAVRDEAVIARLAKLPTRGRDPVKPTIQVGNSEPSEPKNETEAGVGYMKLCDNPRSQAAYWRHHREKVRGAVFNHSRTFTSPQAANSFTTLTHTVLSNQALEAFVYTLQPLRAFSTNFSDAAVNPGDKVKVLYVSGASAATAFTGTYVIQGVTAEGKDITIDQRPYVSWGLSTEEIMTQPQVNMERFAMQKGNALGLSMIQDIFSLITEANYGSSAITTTASGGDQVVVTAANFDLDEVSWLYAACSLDNWPQMPRSLVLSIPYYASLFRESEVIGTEGLASTDPRMLREAEIRRLMGFDIYETNAISATATDNVTGFAAHPDGILIASRTLIPESGMSGSPAVRVLTDPQTGIAIVNREWFDPDNDQSKRVLEVNYGKLKGNANGIKMISSS